MALEQPRQTVGNEPVASEEATVYRYSDAELVRMANNVVEHSQASENGTIDGQRQENYHFYYGLRPTVVGLNTSDYVSWEVFEAVESMKAKMCKTFASNRNVVRWKPCSENDVELADIRTQAVNRIIDGRDGGRAYKVLHDLFHDGLISKLAIVEPVYRKRMVPVVKEFKGVPVEQLEAAAMQEEVERIEIEDEQWMPQIQQTAMGPVQSRVRMASGRVVVLEDRSWIDIDVIPPENVHFGDYVTDLSEPMKIPALAIEYLKPKYQLIEEGIDPEIVAELKRTDAMALKSGTQTARNLIDSTLNEPSLEAETELVNVTKLYIWLDMDTPPEEPMRSVTLWQIVVCDDVLLSKERIEKHSLRFWSPFMISHKAIGLSIADVACDLQSGTSAAMRGMLDHIHRVNAGIRIADMSAIRNPADLIDNPIGGIIDTARVADAITVAPQPPISPATTVVLELLQQQKEQRTGDTRLGKGLNTQQVISHQNAADMIAQLIDVGSDRPMMIARGFAEMLWKPLMLDVYQLAYENQLTVNVDVDGNYQPVNLGQLPYSDTLTVDIALTPDYGDTQARKALTMHTLLAQDPMVAPLYMLEERYALMSEVMHLMGMPNFLANPKDPKTQQRLQMAQQKQQQAQQKQDMMMAKGVELKEREVAAKERDVGGDQQLGKEKVDLDAAKSAAQQNLAEREFQWEQKVDVAELTLEKQQQRAVALGDSRTPSK